MKSVFRTAVVVASLLGAVVNGDDLPQGIVNTQDAADVSLTPQESLARITVPEGFNVTLFAGEPDIRRPIAFDFDDRGRLWVVENYSHPKASKEENPDRIVILEDSDNDGRFDKRKIFWSGGRYLSAIAYGHGGVWVGNSPELSFIPDRNGDDVPDSEPVVILDGFVESSNNVLNNFHWGPDGWLYGAIGLKQMSYVGKPGTPKSDRVAIPRGIWRMHPVTHKFEVQAIGMVNPWGADFNEYGDLITANTVISHLWHIVPGMYLQRRGNEQDYPYAYGRIQSINDHLHWGGGRWTDSRQSDEGATSHQHSVAGGGHAHCGGMVYLGDNWPDRYRGKFFTCNLHGNRVNMDNLVPNGSTYVGTHGDDFLMANDPWFRGLSIKYGPDGGVYITDWHDFGECHDTDGSHRTSGRIYKVVYGETPQQEPFDLATQSVEALFALQMQTNAWHRRHSRRILHERAIAAEPETVAEIDKVLKSGGIRLKGKRGAKGKVADKNVLSMIWAINAVGQATEDVLLPLADATNEHVRRWSVRLISELENPSADALGVLRELGNDGSAKVRLAVAVALQRIPLAARWDIADALLANAKDSDDPFLPYMIWYGVEPLVQTDVPRALELALVSEIPIVRQYIVRRVLDVPDPRMDTVILAALTAHDSRRSDILRGMHEAISDRGQVEPPARWAVLYDRVSNSSNAELKSVAVALARAFGDQQAIGDLRNTVTDKAAAIGDRKSALRALLKLDDAVPAKMLHNLLEDEPLRTEALQALALVSDDSTPDALLGIFPELKPDQRQAAAGVLVSRDGFATRLLKAIDNGKGLAPGCIGLLATGLAIVQKRVDPGRCLRHLATRLARRHESRRDRPLQGVTKARVPRQW